MIDLYLAPTANGQRAAVALAECGLDFKAHRVDLTKGEQRSPEFLKLNPAAQIPVLVDHAGPGGGDQALGAQELPRDQRGEAAGPEPGAVLVCPAAL